MGKTWMPTVVTVICLLTLAVISKYVINIELDFISQYGPVWIFIAYIITRDKAGKSRACSSPLFWSLAIVFVTIAILVVYAV